MCGSSVSADVEMKFYTSFTIHNTVLQKYSIA